MLYYHCFRKDGIMAKDGGWSANLSDLPIIHRYGVGFFFTIRLYLAKYKNNSIILFKKLVIFCFFIKEKYIKEKSTKSMRSANFVLKKIALEAFISYEQMCNNKIC